MPAMNAITKHLPSQTSLALLLILFFLGAAACGSKNPNADAAREEYFKALRGKDTNMSAREKMEHVSNAIRLDPDAPSYWETRAGYLAGERDFAGAESDLDRAIAIADRPYLRFLRGEVRCERGNFLEALRDADRAIAVQPENTQFYGSRVVIRLALKRPEEALGDAELMLRQKANAKAYYFRGLAEAGLGRWQNAVDDFSQSVRMRPELAYPLRARAEAYEHLGDSVLAGADRINAERNAGSPAGWHPCLAPPMN
jgi:tetratricopeptide (TPR) repeat protein